VSVLVTLGVETRNAIVVFEYFTQNLLEVNLTVIGVKIRHDYKWDEVITTPFI
jgi:hypothetical protein